MRNCRIALVASVVLLGIAPQVLAQPVEVTNCGQIVHGDGILVTDLHCGTGEPAVSLTKGSTLDLSGFEITGNAVQCTSRCTVRGPGRISETGTNSCIVSERRVIVDGVDLADCLYGVFAQSKAEVRNSTISASTFGIFSPGKLFIENTDVTDASLAVRGKRVRLAASNISGNRGEGVLALVAVELVASTVVDNCVNSLYTAGGCSDIESRRLPRLDETSSCLHSLQKDSSESWGVCLED